MYLEEFKNDLTKALDEHLKDSVKNLGDFARTYILVDKIGLKNKEFAIRCPGLTIGGVYFSGEYPNDMTITKLVIDDDCLATTMFYKSSIFSFDCDDWIGKKLIINERVEDD